MKGHFDHHGLAVFYLQRHAAELLMKAPLRLAIAVQDYREQLNLPRPAFPLPAQRDRAGKLHALRALLKDLKKMAAALGVADVPEQLSAAVQSIMKFEDDPTWSRYSYRLATRRGVKTFVRHMSKEVVLPLGEIQNMLQCANVALGTIWPFHTATMMGGLGELYHDLVCIAGEID